MTPEEAERMTAYMAEQTRVFEERMAAVVMPQGFYGQPPGLPAVAEDEAGAD